MSRSERLDQLLIVFEPGLEQMPAAVNISSASAGTRGRGFKEFVDTICKGVLHKLRDQANLCYTLLTINKSKSYDRKGYISLTMNVLYNDIIYNGVESFHFST